MRYDVQGASYRIGAQPKEAGIIINWGIWGVIYSY